MMLGSVGGNIQIAALKQPGLRSGELVSVNVIKRLDGNKWAVGIGGRVYPAFSKLDLQPGSTLHARAALNGTRFILTIEANPADSASAALARQGLSDGAADALAASSLLRSGLPVNAELVEKLKAALTKSLLQKTRAARSLSVLMDKGIEVSTRTAQGLLAIIGFGEEGGADRRKYKKGRLPRGKTAAKDIRGLVSAPAGKPEALAVFNHLRGRSQSWIVVPFHYEESGAEYPGTIKLLFDPFLKKPTRMCVSVSPDGEGPVDFHIVLQGKKRVSVFCPDAGIKARMAVLYGGFKANFHNLGFEVDDTIYGSESFDGFSPLWEGASVRAVDTVG